MTLGSFDTNGDGWIDAWDHDTNGDGIADQSGYDTDGDGAADTWYTDLNGDGFAEETAFDFDRNGLADTWSADLDGNGFMEQHVDTTGDGVPDLPTEVTIGGAPDGFVLLPGSLDTGVVEPYPEPVTLDATALLQDPTSSGTEVPLESTAHPFWGSVYSDLIVDAVTPADNPWTNLDHWSTSGDYFTSWSPDSY